jgi:hypothetical protein
LRKALAAFGYLALYVPFGIYFTKDGLPDPYATWLGLAIVAGSGIVGYIVASWWAVLLPLAPWVTALVLIAVSPEGEGSDVGRTGAAFLWSGVFAFLTVLVVIGVASRTRQTTRI